MDSGKFAADVLHESLQAGDVSEGALKKYQDMWYSEFGRDFYWSMKMALLLGRFPIMLDAAAKLIEKRGHRFLAEWAEVMTGNKSKTWFLRLDVWPFLCLEIMSQFVRNLFDSTPKLNAK
jgi:flavin-dependent dehydrogenase